MRTLRTLTAIFLSLFVAGMLLVTQAHAAKSKTTETTMPLHHTLFNPCTGEYVQIEGEMHNELSATVSESGNSQFVHHHNGSATAVGQTTGTVYQGSSVGTHTMHENFSGFPYVETHVHRILLTSEEDGSTFLLMMLFHETINANGEITAYVDQLNIQCK